MGGVRFIMSRATCCLSSVILLGLAACGGVHGTNDSDPVGVSEERAMLAGAVLAPCWPCLVAPDTANPAIVDPAIGREKQWLSDHYVWLDPAVEHREKLFVHLPGQSNAGPATAPPVLARSTVRPPLESEVVPLRSASGRLTTRPLSSARRTPGWRSSTARLAAVRPSCRSILFSRG